MIKKLSFLLLFNLISTFVFADVISRPVANVNTNWYENDYTDIDEVVSSPDAGDGSFIYADKDDDNEQQAYNMDGSGISGNNVVSIVLYVRGRYAGTWNGLTVGMTVGGVELGDWTPTFTTDWAWYSHEWTGTWPAADFTPEGQFQLLFTTNTMVSGDEMDIDAAYAVVSQAQAGSYIYIDGGNIQGGNIGN